MYNTFLGCLKQNLGDHVHLLARPQVLDAYCLCCLQEAPQAARVKVLASGNSIERRFRLNFLNIFGH